MRDIMLARRALLAAFAAGMAVGFRPAAGGAHARRRHKRARHHRRRHRRVIAIDPGHGGIDPGAISPHGFYEKRITLAMARELARRLDRTGRYRTVLTRRRDRFVPLEKRVARARAHHAELFLSIHADALPDRALRGLSVYTLSKQASDRETAELANRENRENFGGLRLSRQPRDVAAVLLDLVRRETNRRSAVLARAIVETMRHTVHLLEKPHRAAAFVVLTAPDIPSALVEIGCLSNPREERLLPRRWYQRRLARGLVRAIDDYFAAAANVGEAVSGPADRKTEAATAGVGSVGLIADAGGA